MRVVEKMRVIETNIMPPGAGAFALFPVGVFVKPGQWSLERAAHEAVHWRHQKAWCLWGLGVGLLLWFLLYLIFLPVGWNPLREFTERRAFRAEGYIDAQIDMMLRRKPYYLWGS
ncbi:MAG TPA: hypothetical protein VFH61_15120 [Thermoleophilia bacterium]|nr:hypothetical protein [Thermoleophilia bacterium]